MKVPNIPVVSGATISDDIMTVKGIFVKQKIELMEVITGFETSNKYKVGKCVCTLGWRIRLSSFIYLIIVKLIPYKPDGLLLLLPQTGL